MKLELSVIIPAHNPDPGRLRRVLAGLKGQTLAAECWETLIVDNASSPPLEPASLVSAGPASLRLEREPRLGLNAARRRGFTASRAPICVLVDDDNVLDSGYLERVLQLFAGHPRVGALGGRSLPEFEREPSPWQREFLPLLALRDPGDRPHFSAGLRPPGATRNHYPAEAAPIGAGMAVRRQAVQPWLLADACDGLTDRRGSELTSAGDNDMVFTLLEQGWEVAYFPELSLTHLIPASRLRPAYLARLNRGIQKSWMQVLTKHDANPWPPIHPWTVPLRQLKAWVTHRAWSGEAARIRWHGARGHFEGRATSA